MSYFELLNKFYRLNRYSKFKYNLDATLELSKACGNPHKKINPIHVTGTNGKGSTVYKIAQVLKDNNLKTGFFTSPHLSTFRERIQINNTFISREYIEEYLKFVFNGIDKGKFRCSFFEALTIMAYKYFSETNVDMAVIEVGIGGRMDSTNILEHNLLAIITSIGLDHVEILGNSIEEILIQKAGIVKKNCPLLIGPEVPPVIPQSIAKDLGSPFYQVNNGSLRKSVFSNSERIAKRAIEIINEHHKMDLEVRPGIIEKNLLGRMEIVKQEFINKISLKNTPKQIIMDVGHNSAALKHCLENIKGYDKNSLIIVYGTSKLKDSAECLIVFSNYSDEIHIVQANNPRAKEIKHIHDDSMKVNIPVNFHANGNICGTLDNILKSDRNLSDKTVLICGSFFIMQEVRDYFGYQDEKDELFLNEYKSM